MGYNTWYSGELTVSPRLPKSIREEINQIAEEEFSSDPQAVFGDSKEIKDIFDGSCFCIEDDPTRIIWDQQDDLRLYLDDMETMLNMFVQKLSQRGFTVTGRLTWEGEEADDHGSTIVYPSGEVESRSATINYDPVFDTSQVIALIHEIKHQEQSGTVDLSALSALVNPLIPTVSQIITRKQAQPN
jgi:hypothetical protein